MFELYFSMADALQRHRTFPLAHQRERFLAYLEDSGTSRANLRTVAAYLLKIVELLRLREPRDVTPDEISRAARRWSRQRCRHSTHQSGLWSQRYFCWMARRWLRFEGRYKPPRVRQPFEKYLIDYVEAMTSERGLSEATVRGRRFRASSFLKWYATRHRKFRNVSATDLDSYIGGKGSKWGLVTRAGESNALRDFFRHAENRNWCKSGTSSCIKSPVIRRDPFEPRGPAWSEVLRLLANSKGSDRAQLRARALLLLFAVCGIRAGEAVRLRLEDIDWQNGTLTVRRSKRGGFQQLPLRKAVGEAIRRYIDNARPKCSCLNVFVTLTGRPRPLIQNTVSAIVHSRMSKLRIRSRQTGPQAIRHAFATQLLHVGTSYREISDLLGHRDTRTVSVYAKLDVNRLHDVSAVDLVAGL